MDIARNIRWTLVTTASFQGEHLEWAQTSCPAPNLISTKGKDWVPTGFVDNNWFT